MRRNIMDIIRDQKFLYQVQKNSNNTDDELIKFKLNEDGNITKIFFGDNEEFPIVEANWHDNKRVSSVYFGSQGIDKIIYFLYDGHGNCTCHRAKAYQLRRLFRSIYYAKIAANQYAVPFLAEISEDISDIISPNLYSEMYIPMFDIGIIYKNCMINVTYDQAGNPITYYEGTMKNYFKIKRTYDDKGRVEYIGIDHNGIENDVYISYDEYSECEYPSIVKVGDCIHKINYSFKNSLLEKVALSAETVQYTLIRDAYNRVTQVQRTISDTYNRYDDVIADISYDSYGHIIYLNNNFHFEASCQFSYSVSSTTNERQCAFYHECDDFALTMNEYLIPYDALPRIVR